MNTTIKVKDISDNTTSNNSGSNLFMVLNNCLKNNEQIEVSFEGVRTISSSYLNSSIGELFDIYGVENVKSKIRFVQLDPVIKSLLIDYINNYSKLHLA